MVCMWYYKNPTLLLRSLTVHIIQKLRNQESRKKKEHWRKYQNTTTLGQTSPGTYFSPSSNPPRCRLHQICHDQFQAVYILSNPSQQHLSASPHGFALQLPGEHHTPRWRRIGGLCLLARTSRRSRRLTCSWVSFPSAFGSSRTCERWSLCGNRCGLWWKKMSWLGWCP